MNARLNMRPGSKLSTTDFDVVLSEAAQDDVHSIRTNNYGSELTGRVVTSAHLEHRNALKMGEKLSLNLQHSDEELWSVSEEL